ncbi:MAG TPA: hypothetical protein VEF89_00355 [Solirubrobacteraceae bacterium]|nr:hypothetical protein [Solirubrobacteraceae bacterium]
MSAGRRSRPAAAPALEALAHAQAIVRYGVAWPVLVARETLAAWDDLMSAWLDVILGSDWDAGRPSPPPVDPSSPERH